MDLQQFRATGRDVIDLGAELPGLDLEGQSGRIYGGEGGLYIELQVDGSWYLILGRSEYVAPLERLEELLYEWAKDEGFFDSCALGHTDTGRGVCADCGKALI